MAEKNGTIGEKVAVLQTQMNEIVIPAVTKMSNFIDDNRSGIRTASILDNKIVTFVIGAIIAAGGYIIAKGGL